ncbi:MAG: glycosyltransferase family 2 protein [Clostridium sp.]
MKITVFTPTYNREKLISRLYESLTLQDNNNFEWIVIDDGSVDNTEELFNEILEKNNNFKIIYKKVENGGKHRAINKGLELASGELFFIVDSDDMLKPNAISEVIKMESSLKDNKEFCGVAGVRVTPDDEIIGGWNSDKSYIDCSNIERFKNGLLGDKSEIYYTNILRKYKFPEIDGEKFLSEKVVWDKIANDGYKIRWFNKKIYVCEYQDGGLTDNFKRLIINNPKGYTLEIKGEYNYSRGKLKRLKIVAEYLKYMDDIYDRNYIIKLFKINVFEYYISKGIKLLKSCKE